MSATGLDVFDKTVQTTNTWLKEIGEQIGPDRQRCYQALRAVLFSLRDRLNAGEACAPGRAAADAGARHLLRGLSGPPASRPASARPDARD